VVAHGALLGAVYLFLLHAPLQVTGAIWQRVQKSMFVPGRDAEPERIVLALALAGAVSLLGLAVFVAFPFIQGGVLGQVRDRLDSPLQPTGSFGTHGRAHYSRLLCSQGLFALIVMVAVVVPIMGLVARLAYEVEQLGEVAESEQLHPLLFPWSPLVFALMAAMMVVVSVAGMVYWTANCIVVAEGKKPIAAWRQALAFCRRNAGAVLALWLVNLVVGLLLAPLSLLGQWGIVTAQWAVLALAVVYSAVIAYWSVIVTGMCMSLYLERRSLAGWSEPPVPSAAG
jgi:hypothetical protein